MDSRDGNGNKRKRRSNSFDPSNDRENLPPSNAMEVDRPGEGRATRFSIAAAAAAAASSAIAPAKSHTKVPASSPASSSSRPISKASVKALPLNLLQQVQKSSATLESVSTSKRANKWMRRASPEKQDMRSVLERRIGEMRRFLSEEGDENENEISMDTETNFF